MTTPNSHTPVRWWKKILIAVGGFFAGIFGGIALAFIMFMLWAAVYIGLIAVGIFAPYPAIGDMTHALQDYLFAYAGPVFRACLITGIVFFTLISNHLVVVFKRR